MVRQYVVTGMSCAACQARVEKAVSELPGVSSCAVSLITNSMGIEGNASDAEIIRAVENAGYGASPMDEDASPGENILEDRETPVLVRRLISSVIFLAALMYVSMGHAMFGFPLPEILEGNGLGIALCQLVLSLIILIINRRFFISGFKAALHLAPNMDTLVAMGAGAAFLWSLFITGLIFSADASGDKVHAMEMVHELYYESAATIVTLITVGKLLEAISKGRTTSAIKKLMNLAPEEATVVREGKEVRVPLDAIVEGDIFLVKPGEKIPTDGIVMEGVTSVDEAALTGESIPVDKSEGDEISQGTVNLTGFVRGKASRVGSDTTIARIVKLVTEAQTTKAPIARIADTISAYFVPAVMIVALIAAIAWIIFGKQTYGYALARGISVLVVSCPCALGLATPVAIMAGSGKGASKGILFKTSESLESTGKSAYCVLDKTGTVTKGEPVVTDIITRGESKMDSDARLLALACSLEKKSEHPLAKAIIREGEKFKLPVAEAEDFGIVSGSGLFARIEGHSVYGGNKAFMKDRCVIPKEVDDIVERLQKEGKTCIFFSSDSKLQGVIAVADEVKEESAEAVRQLGGMGLETVMLTGDNARTAEAIGKTVGVDRVISDVLPDQKDSVIKELQKTGRVIMVGDGINDAPALTRADIGMAIGAGSDIAIDSADVVLMNSSPLDVAAAVRLSRATLRNIKENLFWAFIYNVLLIPVAAGAYVHLTGWTFSPMLGALAMSLSSFCVVMNALRLNLFDPQNSSRDRSKDCSFKKPSKEANEMEKTIKIEGMMCGHCEATVKEALEATPGVTSADVSHEKDMAVVTVDSAVTDDVLTKAIEDKNYKVISIAS